MLKPQGQVRSKQARDHNHLHTTLVIKNMQLFSYCLVLGVDMNVSQLQLKCRQNATHSKLKGKE